jgi:hypothetical protein
MVHYLGYVELTWYVSLGLYAFRLLSQFAIKMIAIFARDKFSDRAFRVLRISRLGQNMSIRRRRRGKRSVSQARSMHGGSGPMLG